jgi:hypothetical protein
MPTLAEMPGNADTNHTCSQNYRLTRHFDALPIAYTESQVAKDNRLKNITK